MHELTELPAWERLFKRIVWEQTDEVKNKLMLDYGSGEGITANYFAAAERFVRHPHFLGFAAESGKARFRGLAA